VGKNLSPIRMHMNVLFVEVRQSYQRRKNMAKDVCKFTCNKCGYEWEALRVNIKKNGWPKHCPNHGCADFQCECGCTRATGCKCDECGCDSNSCGNCSDDKAKQNKKKHLPGPKTSGCGSSGCGGCGSGNKGPTFSSG